MDQRFTAPAFLLSHILMMMIEMECETEDISGNLDRFLEGLHFTGSDEIKKLDSVIYPISIDKVENQSMGV